MSFWCVFDRDGVIRYVGTFVLIGFQERFQIAAFYMKMLIALVWAEHLNASKWNLKNLLGNSEGTFPNTELK